MTKYLKSFLTQNRLKAFILLLLIPFLLLVITRLVHTGIINALTQSFVQTDWSGGTDVGATVTDSDLTGWTKYYSATNGLDTSQAGQVQLKVGISTP